MITNVQISDRSLLNIVNYFMSQGAWGGNTPEIAEAIAEIYETFNIEELTNRASRAGATANEDFTVELVEYTISILAYQILRAILGRKVPDNVIGRLGTMALRHIPKLDIKKGDM